MRRRTPLVGALAGAVALGTAAVPLGAQRPAATNSTASAALGVSIPEKQVQNGIAYRAGGIGSDVRERMQRAATEFNLRLSFAASADRHYVPDVRVVVRSAEGRTLLDVRDAGPLFYVDLPPGAYQLEATYLGTTKTRTVRVDGGLARADFLWQGAHAD